ncbi:Pentatricopeptide repeat-containing protein, mitochondrial [Glycine soja]
MITGYMKFGRVELAERLFQQMSMRILVTWNTMIAGYVKNGRAEDGLRLFRTMLETGVKPNALSLTSVLLGCSNLSALQLGKQVHQLVCKSPLSSDTTAGTLLFSMYSKCGDLKDARGLFVRIPRKDVVFWNAMISEYAQHGAGEKALCLFDEMKNRGMKPDWITFVAVLLACNHAGLVDLGSNILTQWIHKNLHLDKNAAKNLLEPDPTIATGYVQLANIYKSCNLTRFYATETHVNNRIDVEAVEMR